MGKNYLDNKDLERTICQFIACSTVPNEYGPHLISLFDVLIHNIYSSFKFKVEYDDAAQDCFLVIFQILKNFDPSKSSAFNYFTTVIANELRRIYSKDKKYETRLTNYKAHLIEKGELDEQG